MSNREEKYTVVLHNEAAKMLIENPFASYFVNNDSNFGQCIRCASIDPAGAYLSIAAFLTKEIVVDIQIPHTYVLYIFGGDSTQIGFKLKK
jgi:hypothetical protein